MSPKTCQRRQLNDALRLPPDENTSPMTAS
jgi:hypothetical protein